MMDHSELHQLTKDVTEMLSEKELAALRGAYDGLLLSELATKTLVEKFPASRIWVNTIQRILYVDESRGGAPLLDITPKERELCLITLLSAQHLELELGVHIYWGMMEGLSPKQIAALITMVGVYAGLARFNSALTVMTTALKALDVVAQKPNPDVVACITALVAAFSGDAEESTNETSSAAAPPAEPPATNQSAPSDLTAVDELDPAGGAEA